MPDSVPGYERALLEIYIVKPANTWSEGEHRNWSELVFLKKGIIYNSIEKGKIITVKNMREITEIPIWEKLTLTKQEAALYSNIGINKLEELLKDPKCPFVLYVGTKKLVKRKEFEQFIAKMLEI